MMRFWLFCWGLAAAYEQHWTFVPNNLTGCLDDPYYFDVFFLNLGQGQCKVDANDLTSDGYGTTQRLPATSLDQCLGLCYNQSSCTGVEYVSLFGSCSLWNQTIGYVRGSAWSQCIGLQAADCTFFEDTNCTAALLHEPDALKLERLQRACPNTCLEVSPSCPSGFQHRDVMVGGLYMSAAYESGFNLFFTMNGQSSAVNGELEVVAVAQDGVEDVEERTEYLTSRAHAKFLLGPYGDEVLEASAQVAEEYQAVLMAPASKSDSHVNRSTVFTLARPYAETLLAPLQKIAEKEMATVSYIMPSQERATDLNLLSNYKSCEKIPQTVQMAQLVLLGSEVLDDASSDAWPEYLSSAMDRLLTPRPDVIICCESSLVCATEILNITYHKKYDPKAFIIFDDDHLTLPMNFGAATSANFYIGERYVRDYIRRQLQVMGDWQSQEVFDLWMAVSFYSMGGNTGGYHDIWSDEAMELMKECLVVSDWDRLSVPAVGFIYLHHYLVRGHARPEAALAAASAAVLLEAVAAANSTAVQDVVDQLMSMQFATVAGDTTFDALGQRAAGTSTVQLSAYKYLPMGNTRPLYFWLDFLTPGQRGSLKYPRTSWREHFCTNEYLTPHDGRAYGLVLDNVTQRMVCEPCPSESISEYDARQGYRVCLECPPGKYTSGGHCEDCEEGYFSDVAGASACTACQPGQFQRREGRSFCDPCPPGTFNSQAAGLSCQKCSDTFDASDQDVRPRWAPAGSATCSTCPLGALCEPDALGFYTNYTNADGFYSFVNASNGSFGSIYRCTHGLGQACLARGECYADATGATAMMGPMCGSCAPGFAKPIGKPLNLCSRCPSLGSSAMGVTLQLLTVFGMASLLMIVNFLSDYAKPKNILSITLKQLFNYIQMAFAVLSTGGSHGLYGGASVKEVFLWIQDYLGMSSTAWVPESGACLIQAVFPDWKMNQVLTVLGLSWFPGTAVLSIWVFLMVKCCRYVMGRKTDVKHLKTWLMVNLFLFIPRVNRLLLVNFQCSEYDINRLLVDPSVDCWSEEHAIYQLLSWSGILVFSVGGPLFLYLILRNLKRKQLLSSFRVLRTYGFLFAGFEPDFYYFECIYMVRKLCFELVMTLPGMTSKDEEALGRINNSSVAFVASIFFALHMACQPYDNREYFILDRIETASLRAILVTAFLQLWCLDTNDADGIVHNNWLRNVRNTACTVVIGLLHLRFFWLFFYAIARRSIQGCVATIRGKDFSHGTVVFVPDGLQLRNLKGVEELLLSTMTSEIMEMHSQAKRKLGYDHWAGSLQMLCLEARRAAIEAEILALDKVGSMIRSWRELSGKLFRGSRLQLICERILDRVEDAYGVVSNKGSYQTVKKEKDKELEELRTFGAGSLNKLLNKEFRVEELQDAMLKLGKSICDNKRIAGLGEEEPPGRTMEFFVGPMPLTHEMDVVEQRALAQELMDLKREVEERNLESQDLRRQLTQARRERRRQVSIEVDSESEGDEFLTELQEAQGNFEEAKQQRDGLKVELQQQRQEMEKEEERRGQVEAALAEQTTKVKKLEEQLKKLSQVRIVCWSCGAKMPEDAIYCFKCGKALDGE